MGPAAACTILAIAAALTCSLPTAATAQTEQFAPEPRTSPEHVATLRWDNSQRGRPIDLSQFRQTFNDDFKAMDIVKEDSDPGPGAVWFSPGHGAFRTNSPLRKDGPFALVDDGLRLRVEKVGNRYLGACMATVNTKGQGFAQQYGYFEMTARYDYRAPYEGLWGAFWLKSQKDYFTGGTTTRTEIDINEFYGDDSYHASVHLWAAAKLAPDATITKSIHISGHQQRLALTAFRDLKAAGGGVVTGFHTYGGEITPQYVIIYFDRKELGRFPMVDEWKTPLYMLVDMDPTRIKPEQSSLPMDLIVRNVSVYQPLVPYEGQ
jgi:beta-glucanase (GH16 family)